jgi:hypothetical protein
VTHKSIITMVTVRLLNLITFFNMFCIRQLHIGGGTLCEHLITFYYFLLIFPDSNLPFNGSTNYWTGQDDRESVSRGNQYCLILYSQAS